MSRVPSSPYNLSFTTATLRPELSLIVAETRLELGDWNAARSEILERNLLQSPSRNSAKKLEGELRLRLSTLTEGQLTLLATGSVEDRLAICWLSMLKRSGFIMDFASEALRSKIEYFDTTLRESDYENFIAEKQLLHPELLKITEETAKQIKSRLLSMLREIGILTPGDGIGTINRIVVPETVLSTISDDDPSCLRGFLFTEAELAPFTPVT